METKTNDFTITEDLIRQATSYVPLSIKGAFAKTRADECLEKVDISVQKLEADTLLALPAMWQENTVIKQAVLMYAFLTLYLHVENVPNNFSVEDYDKYAHTHPLNQLERLKTNSAVKEKVFDIIADYKEFKKMLDIEIYNVKTAKNDGMERALAAISVISSPEAVKAMAEEMQHISQSIQEAQKKRKAKKQVAEQESSAANKN